MIDILTINVLKHAVFFVEKIAQNSVEKHSKLQNKLQ